MKTQILFIVALCISVVMQAQISKTITNLAPGELKSSMTSNELSTVTDLTLLGTMDARDFKTIKDDMPAVAEVDLTNVLIAEYTETDGSAPIENKTFPANTIPEKAFYGKSSLTRILLPASITTVDKGAFAYCYSLASIVLPPSVITLGDDAFHYCISLRSVVLPVNGTSIGIYAFAGCQSLNSIMIPATVNAIGKSAFAECSAYINVDSENTAYSSVNGVLFNKNKTELIQCPVSQTGYYAVPPSVKTIGIDAFTQCKNLTSVSLPNSVTRIAYRAFSDCTGLTAVNIPDSVTTLNGAFYGCTGLTTVTLPNSLTSIDWEFSGCTGLTSITIPNSITTIDHVFMGCIGLKSIIIPNSVTTIGENSFFDCSGLQSITIPNSVTTIKGAFGECSGLTSITIPNSVTTIGDDSFYYCTGLTSVTIPNSVITIGIHAFLKCTSLKSVTIPNSVAKISNSAFYGCTSLKSLTIPASVTSMGDYAFADCEQLAAIYAYPATPAEMLVSNVFEGVNKNTCILHVPAGSLELYKAANVWKDFIKTDVITSTDMEIKNLAITISPNPAKDVITIHADKGLVSIYNSNGKLELIHSLEQNKQLNISALKPGLYVVVVNGESLKIIKE